MKITDVEGIILESPDKYLNPAGSEEATGVAYCFLIKISTDEGITGWSDVETAPCGQFPDRRAEDGVRYDGRNPGNAYRRRSLRGGEDME